jgi:hypothetical protein
LALLLALPAAGLAQAVPTPDLSGDWSLQTDALAPGLNLPCLYSGTAQVSQTTAGDFTGQAELFLLSGMPPCPDRMAATLQGLVSGTVIEVAMLSGELGSASFSGDVDPGARSVAGSFVVEQGPFAGGSGTWSAVVRQAALEIPTLSVLGLTLLALLLAVVGWLILRRPSRASPRA